MTDEHPIQRRAEGRPWPDEPWRPAAEELIALGFVVTVHTPRFGAVELDVYHPAEDEHGTFTVSEKTGRWMRASFNGDTCTSHDEVLSLLRMLQPDRGARGVDEFVQRRLREDEHSAARPKDEIQGLRRVVNFAIGCPTCGGRSGAPHACPGWLGGAGPDNSYLDDPYDPWANVLRGLALLWKEHPEYNPAWEPE